MFLRKPRHLGKKRERCLMDDFNGVVKLKRAKRIIDDWCDITPAKSRSWKKSNKTKKQWRKNSDN